MMRLSTRYLDATTTLFTYPDFRHYDPVSNTLPPPFCLDGQAYFRHKKLGSGAYGTAWLFIENKTRKMLVLKCESSRPQGLNNVPFEIEARVHSAIYGFGLVSNNRRFLLTRYFEGQPAADFLSIRSPELILRVWILIAAAFKNLHEAGFVHCDGHLHNVIVAQNLLSVFLIDFGLSCRRGQLRKDCDLLPKEAIKSKHLPPENFLGHRPVSERLILASSTQDAYSVGWHLLAFIEQYRRYLSHPDLFASSRELKTIANQLMASDPLKRISIQHAIALVITCGFPEKIYSKPEKILVWSLLASTIFEMRRKVVFSLQNDQAQKEHDTLTHFINDLALITTAAPQMVEPVFIEFSSALIDHEANYHVLEFATLLFLSFFKSVKEVVSKTAKAPQEVKETLPTTVKPPEEPAEEPAEAIPEVLEKIVLPAPAAVASTSPAAVYVVGQRPKKQEAPHVSPKKTPIAPKEVTGKITDIKRHPGPLLTPPCILERRKIYTSPVKATIRRRVWGEAAKDTVATTTCAAAETLSK